MSYNVYGVYRYDAGNKLWVLVQETESEKRANSLKSVLEKKGLKIKIERYKTY